MRRPVELLAVAVALLVTVVASAQEAQHPKVPESRARATALAKVANGRVRSEELEREGGRLIYSYDIAVPGRSGIEEVNVDAMTGAVVNIQHEGAGAERAEAAQEAGRQPRSGAHGAPYGRWLIDRVRMKHPALKSVELAIVRNGSCRTVAATAPEDLGETCDADENGPMRTGQPDVEAPSRSDPVYDITQALHDAHGSLVGAVGMDIAPGNRGRAAALALAREVRRELEALIPSKQRVFGPAPSK